MFLPGEICPALRPPMVGAPHAVMHGVTGQKSAEGIVVDSLILMKRRPEAKGGIQPLSSALSFGRPVNQRCRRRVDGPVFPTINQLGSLEIGWSDYGSTFLVTARCGPACRVVWEGGGLKPPSYPSYVRPCHRRGFRLPCITATITTTAPSTRK